MDEPCLEVLQTEIKRGNGDDVLIIPLLQNALTVIKRRGGSPRKGSPAKASGIGLSKLEEDLKLANMHHQQQHNRYLDYHRRGDSTLRAEAAVGGVAGKNVTPRSLVPPSATHQRHLSPSRAVAANPFGGLAVSERSENDKSGSLSHRMALRQSMSALPLSLASQRGDSAATPRQKGLPWGDKLSLLELQLQAADYGDMLRQ
jgi:hypothetical protein